MAKSMFVTDERVPIYEFDPDEIISDEPPSVVWIRAKMNVGIKKKVEGHIARMAKNGDVELTLDQQQMALFIYNILDWDGPRFLDGLGQKVPCTPANIERLDPSDPFFEKVVNAIGERNRPTPSPNPKSHESNGLRSVGPVAINPTDDQRNPSATMMISSSLRRS
jgi:hypothetical protein